MRTLTLSFSQDGEEVIVLRALVDIYLKVVGQIDQFKRECADDDEAALMILADATDRCHAQADKLNRRLQRASARMAQEEPVDGVQGLAPAAMAQGCAAFSPAVGPANAADQSRADARPAEPLFLVSQRQELPVRESVNYLPANRGLTS